MVKKLISGCVLALLITECFAGYSSGGRSGYSSARSSSSYSIGRSGYSRPTTYSQPRNYSSSYQQSPSFSRSYSGTSSSTVIHNNNYSHGGSGFGMGGGFFSGLLGGYIGGSLASSHNPVVVAAGGAPVMAGDGQGMLVNNGGYAPSFGGFSLMFPLFFLLIFIVIVICVIKFLFSTGNSCNHNRW